MAHSARSAAGRTSSTVTGRPSSSQTRKVSTSIVLMFTLLFRFQWESLTHASQEVLLPVGVRDTPWHAAGKRLHRRTHNTVLGNRRRCLARGKALADEPPAQGEGESVPGADVRQRTPPRDAHRAG